MLRNLGKMKQYRCSESSSALKSKFNRCKAERPCRTPSQETGTDSVSLSESLGKDMVVAKECEFSKAKRVVVLRVSLHCHCRGCEGKVKKRLSRMQGQSILIMFPFAKLSHKKLKSDTRMHSCLVTPPFMDVEYGITAPETKIWTAWLDIWSNTASATFVVFVSKRRKKVAARGALEKVNFHRYELSSCLADLDGQQYLFHIWLTPYNFTPRNRTFTVSAISDDIVPKPHSEGERSVNPPQMDLHLRNHLLLCMQSGDEPPNIGKLIHQYH
ncbi:hypothetical protein Bca52824_033235 [Brassica carinata]|uniref:Uncharacterized protein n=1 Tax=Brassica carinata TaxID=52824 RepID=A0A8X7SIF0_BRACI|nr:hypothetical protein Bca52824_033235 [Brassica carinata]